MSVGGLAADQITFAQTLAGIRLGQEDGPALAAGQFSTMMDGQVRATVWTLKDRFAGWTGDLGAEQIIGRASTADVGVAFLAQISPP